MAHPGIGGKPRFKGAHLRPHDIGAMVENGRETGINLVTDARLLGRKVDKGYHEETPCGAAMSCGPECPNSV